MYLNFKKLSSKAVTPTRANPGDAGLDITATSILESKDNQIIFGTDLAFEIPEGYVGLLFPRSSIRKTGLALANSVGVIDSSYRGEVQITFNWVNEYKPEYKVGEKVAQLVLVPFVETTPNEVEDISNTTRGDKGHGSSGN